MSETYGLEINTNATEFPYEKKFPAIMTLGDLKKKLELVVGAVAESIKIDLQDSEGKFVAALTDDKRTLKDLGVKDGMKIFAVDTTGGNQELQDDSMVEKYTMSDDKYNEREDSVRAWKKKLQEEHAAKGDSSSKELAEKNEQAAANIKVGDRCEVRINADMPRRGIVAFVGKTQFKDGQWIGVKYDEPVGKNDGSVAGVKYFTCDNKYGGFVRPVDVVVGDFPELSIEDNMDEI